ncbi:MAG: T9SS type A sorting domain-containing protein [Bacteroidota bacterium]|nr:T9SS type A sorting domain-containing protein [Bacteroidota bacterium]
MEQIYAPTRVKQICVSLLGILYFFTAHAQVEQTINVPYTSSATPTYQALLYLPSGYSTATSTSYPLIVFCHGASEAADGKSTGLGLAKIYNQANAGGPAYFIEHNQWPASFTNPVNGKSEQFIVVSPQAGDWGVNGDQLANIVNYIVNTYRVDKNRIHLTGILAGGAGVVEYASQLDPNEDPPAQASDSRSWKPASIVPMSSASNEPAQSWGNISVTNTTPCWGFGDPNNDLYGGFTLDFTTTVNNAKAGYARFTSFNTGSGPWNPYFNPTYTENFSWNGKTAAYSIYSWMLANSRGTSTPPPAIPPPTSNAGAGQTITLPVNSVTLNGSGAAGTGSTLSSYVWTLQSGPSGSSMSSPSAASTKVTFTVAGSYVFALKVTQQDGQTATSQVTITVNPAISTSPPPVPTPTVSAGLDQAITLPVSTATLTAIATPATGKTITKYAWTKSSGPSGGAIATPSSVTTLISGLLQGTYVFSVTVTQSDNQTASAKVTITVNPVVSGAYLSPSIRVGGNQSTSANTVNLTSSDVLTGANLKSVAWTKFSVPGQTKKRIGLLGSSTTIGNGASNYDSSYAGRLLTYYKSAGIIDTVINMAAMGYDVYQAMPTGYVPPADVTAKMYPTDTPDPARNITAMLQQKPDVVIVCFPTNGFDVLTISEIMTPFQTIYNTCTAAGVQCYITTSQPRTDPQFNQASQQFLQVVRDSILNRFGSHAINFYDAVTVPGTTNQMPQYAYYDNIHLNDAGHLALFNVVVGANIFQNLISSPAAISTPAANNTAVANLPQGINRFQATVTDSHGQAASAVTTITVGGTSAVQANAGANQTIQLPANSVTLNGNVSTGTITSYAWTKVSGPNTPAIASPSSVSTSITGLVQGTYVFQLSVNGGASTSQVTITVNGATVSVQANAGGNQTIQLPATSVTLNGNGSTGTITSYTWTKVSGPNTPAIASPSSVSTSVTGLVQGTYVFQLSVNGGASTSQVTITVNAVSTQPPGNCHGTAYMPAPGGDGGYYNTQQLNPGDTLFLDGTKSWSYVYIAGQNGTNACPIVVMNKGGQAVLSGDQFKLYDCVNLKVLGTGVPSIKYGILVRPYPEGTVQNGIFAFTINGRSKDIEVSNVSIRNAGIGFEVKEDGGCDPNYNYPSWVIDSISIHDNSVVHTWNEGMYLGNTSPDNSKGNSDPRPVDCNGVTQYPRPIRVGNLKVYNNFVDSTGRGGIQLASASTGISEIYNNSIHHNGINGDDAQGAAITLGTYTHAYVHDNTISNTYTWGIASVGGSGTGIPLRIENNTIDSSGFLNYFDLAQAPDGTVLNYAGKSLTPSNPANLTWPQAIAILTRPVEDIDSTEFWIKNNKIGKYKSPTMAITLEDGYGTVQRAGNQVCGNTNFNGSAAIVSTVNTTFPITYSNSCAVQSQDAIVGLASTDSAMTINTATPVSAATTPTYTVFPNPVRDNFLLELNNSHTGSMQVSIVDANGSVKHAYQFTKDQQISQVNLSAADLPAGVYFITVQIGSWRATKKIVKL